MNSLTITLFVRRARHLCSFPAQNCRLPDPTGKIFDKWKKCTVPCDPFSNGPFRELSNPFDELACQIEWCRPLSVALMLFSHLQTSKGAFWARGKKVSLAYCWHALPWHDPLKQQHLNRKSLVLRAHSNPNRCARHCTSILGSGGWERLRLPLVPSLWLWWLITPLFGARIG